MAKRAPKEEKPFRPLEAALIHNVMMHSSLEESADSLESSEPSEYSVVEVGEVIQKAAPPAKPEAPLMQVVPKKVDQHIQAARAVMQAPIAEQPIDETFYERKEKEKRFLVSATEEAELNQLVTTLAKELGCTLKLSHIVRACMKAVLNSKDEIIVKAKDNPALIRPANGDLAGIDRFDTELAKMVIAGIKRGQSLD